MIRIFLFALCILFVFGNIDVSAINDTTPIFIPFIIQLTGSNIKLNYCDQSLNILRSYAVEKLNSHTLREPLNASYLLKKSLCTPSYDPKTVVGIHNVANKHQPDQMIYGVSVEILIMVTHPQKHLLSSRSFVDRTANVIITDYNVIFKDYNPSKLLQISNSDGRVFVTLRTSLPHSKLPPPSVKQKLVKEAKEKEMKKHNIKSKKQTKENTRSKQIKTNSKESTTKKESISVQSEKKDILPINITSKKPNTSDIKTDSDSISHIDTNTDNKSKTVESKIINPEIVDSTEPSNNYTFDDDIEESEVVVDSFAISNNTILSTSDLELDPISTSFLPQTINATDPPLPPNVPGNNSIPDLDLFLFNIVRYNDRFVSSADLKDEYIMSTTNRMRGKIRSMIDPRDTVDAALSRQKAEKRYYASRAYMQKLYNTDYLNRVPGADVLTQFDHMAVQQKLKDEATRYRKSLMPKPLDLIDALACLDDVTNNVCASLITNTPCSKPIDCPSFMCLHGVCIDPLTDNVVNGQKGVTLILSVIISFFTIFILS